MEGSPKVAQRNWVMPRCPVISAMLYLSRHFIHASDIFAQVDLATANRGSTNRIIPAVGEPAGSFDQDGAERLFIFRYDAKDSAHKNPHVSVGLGKASVLYQKLVIKNQTVEFD